MEAYQVAEVENYEKGTLAAASVRLIRESALHISVNGHFLVRLACSGNCLEYLSMGFMHSCGLLEDASDVARMTLREEAGQHYAEVELKRAFSAPETTVTSGLGWYAQMPRRMLRPMPRAEKPRWALDSIMEWAAELERCSEVYHLTHGCHNSALCDAGGIVLQREDIGRHNAIDMLVGQCLMEGRDVREHIIVSSGRIASEMVQKAIRAGFPVYASMSSATSHAVATAREMGLTLVGNVSARGLRIYNDNGQLLRP